MKKLLFIRFVILFFFSYSYVSGETIYVDDNNISGIEDGSLEYPYNTVEEGISTAIATDTVFIFNGYYLLSQYLKDGIIIQGEDSANTILSGSFNNSDFSMEHYTEIYNLRCDGVYLSMGDGNATIKIKNCYTTSVGFSTGSGYHFIIEDCTIESSIGNNSGNCFLTIKNNYIIDGYISDSGGAPANEEAHIIDGNEIYYSSYDDNTDAAIKASSFQVTISNNIIEVTGGASGIIVSTGPPTNIIGNQITIYEWAIDDNTTGIKSSAGFGVVIGNKIDGGKIGYWSSSGATLFENNTIMNCHYGFYSSGNEEVKNNEISNCTGHGLVLCGVKGPISQNNIHHNDSAGVFLIFPCDLGGGEQSGLGLNKLQNNGYYDLIVNCQSFEHDTVFARNNFWDHNTMGNILSFDVNWEECEDLFIDVMDFNPSAVTNVSVPITGLSLYPNPANDIFEVRSLEFKVENANIELFNLNGRKLLSKNIQKGNENIEIDISPLKSGIYFCKISTDKKNTTKKLIIE